MAEMSDEMIVKMIQQHLGYLQRFIKADRLSASHLELIVHHAWEIEWYAKHLLDRKRKEEDKN